LGAFFIWDKLLLEVGILISIWQTKHVNESLIVITQKTCGSLMGQGEIASLYSQ
jgi:hypothetical protein